MSVQSEFINFNKKIKVDYDVKSDLAEKRDILVDILRNSDRLPGFEVLNQGSYSMFTGAEPIDDKEYDIDVGLRFNCNKSEYEPTDFKNIIQDVLKNHTDYGAKVKKPCVTVTYKRDGEPAYHVDLVTYTYDDKDDHDSQMYLAHGKDSCPDEISWEKSDPKGLIDYINNAVDKENRDQFRRIIRYFKRWKNIKFDCSGHSEPTSIGITLIAADYFQPFSNNDELDDLNATLELAKSIKGLFRFECVNEMGRELYRLKYSMPIDLLFESDTDAFKKMTDSQMTDFKDKIEKMISDLETAKYEADEIEQCKILNKIFGDDFHIPEVKNVSKSQKSFIPMTSASGDINERT